MMNRIRCIHILLFLLLLPFPAAIYAASWEAKVVSISNGDIIKVLKDGKQVKIRLTSIDCSEKGQPYGQRAKQFTADMVADKVVKIWQTDTDHYRRIVGFVFVGDKNLNKELLSDGLAWHYKYYSRDPEIAEFEFKARSDKRGLWAEQDPVPPWDWRKHK